VRSETQNGLFLRLPFLLNRFDLNRFVFVFEKTMKKKKQGKNWKNGNSIVTQS